jgi:hypothetical protein
MALNLCLPMRLSAGGRALAARMPQSHLHR